MIMSELEVLFGENSTVMLFNNPSMVPFLLQQLGANIVETLEVEKPTYDETYNEFKLNGASATLKLLQQLDNGRSWANHGYHNAFQFQVSFIYATISSIKNMKQANSIISINSPYIPLYALKLYQQKKTEWITKEKEVKKLPHWGDGYNKINWSDQNERILELLEIPKEHEYWKVLANEINPHGDK